MRTEEFLNYFRFDYPDAPSDAPFSVTSEIGTCPWEPKHRLVLLGLQGRKIDASKLPARNLVYLLDVSGSMNDPLKLPLLQAGMRMLTNHLTKKDHVAIVVYAGASGLVLPSTPGDHTQEIAEAIDRLQAGGSTNGGQGIELAYRIAREGFIEGGVNRVILATDGDFNVGITDMGISHPSHRGAAQERRLPLASSASARATSRTPPWRSSPTRATATTPTSTRSRRPARCSSRRLPAPSSPSPRT